MEAEKNKWKDNVVLKNYSINIDTLEILQQNQNEIDYALFLADHSNTERRKHDQEVARILGPLDIHQTGHVDRTIFEIADPKD